MRKIDWSAIANDKKSGTILVDKANSVLDYTMGSDEKGTYVYDQDNPDETKHYVRIRGNLVECDCRDESFKGDPTNICKHVIRCYFNWKDLKALAKGDLSVLPLNGGDVATIPAEYVGRAVQPIVSVEEIKHMLKELDRLKKEALEKNDFQKGKDGKMYIKKSGFRKLAVAFNLSVELVDEQRVVLEDKHYWKVVSKVIAPNGRYTYGVGIASSDERGFSKPEHDMHALAYTRAANRAIGDIIGSGDVSYEEVNGRG